MCKKLLALLCVTAILASMPIAVSVSADAGTFNGVFDRQEYKNAGYNTQITITFDKEVTSNAEEINKAVSLVKSGTQEIVSGVKTKLENDKKTLNVYLEGCSLAANTQYTLTAAGIKSGTATADLSVNITTGAVNEKKYVYENFEGYAKGGNWTDKPGGVPDNTWQMTPSYNGRTLKTKADVNASFPSIKRQNISSTTHNVEASYESIYKDLTIDVRQDPTNAANNVLYYDAGNQQGYDGLLYARLQKRVGDGTTTVVPSDSKFVHGFKAYIPADGYSSYVENYTTGRKSLFGSITDKAWKYASDYTCDMLYNGGSDGKMSFRYVVDGAANYKFLTLEADTWYDIKYVFNTATDGKYDIYVNGEKVVNSCTPKKNYGGVEYRGVTMAIAPVYNSGGKSPKMYYDDLKSYILENLTAADGTTANKNKFSALSDKVIINFSSEINKSTFNDALTVKKTDGTAVKPVWNVEWKDNGTTAEISFADGLKGDTTYSLTLSDAVKDIFGQTLSKAASFAVNFTTGYVPAAKEYLVNDNFEDMPTGNWIGNGYPTGVDKDTWWVGAGSAGDSGDTKNDKLQYVDKSNDSVLNILSDAYIGAAESPDGKGNRVFKYSSGTENADSKKSYRVVRRVGKTSGFTVDRTKQLVAKYKIWLEDNVPEALGTNEKRDQKIPEFATSASGLDTAMQTNVRAVGSNGSIDKTKIQLQHERWRSAATIDIGKWVDITYVITPAAESDTTGKMKYSIYIDGKPIITDWASDEGVWKNAPENRYKLYGFKFNIVPEAEITKSGTMYIDDLQMYQTPSFTVSSALSGLVSTKEPITVYFNNAVSADQYDKTNKTIVPFDRSFVSVVDAASNVVVGNPSAKLIDNGYGVELGISDLKLERGKEYKIVFSGDLRDVSYQPFVQPATALTFTPSNSNNVYLSEYVQRPTVVSKGVETKLKISNPTIDPKPVWYAVAVYGDYNELIGITSLDPDKPLTLGAGQQTETISIRVEPSASSVDFATAARKIKIFLWDGCTEMNPYAPVDETVLGSN